MVGVDLFLSPPVSACLLCVLAAFLFFYLASPARKSAFKWPPGPTPLPLIGNLHLLDIKRQDKSIMKLAKKYGSVFTLHFGFQRVVVLTGYEAVKEALVNFTDEFASRPPIPIFEEIQGGNGLFFSTGELWRTTRRFTMYTMRSLGVGRRLMEDWILEETGFLVEKIKSLQGEPFNLRTFNAAPTNITFVLLFGARFDYKDPTFLTLLRLIDEVMCLLGSPYLHLLCFGPFGHVLEVFLPDVSPASVAVIFRGQGAQGTRSSLCALEYKLFNFYPFLGVFLNTHKTLLKKVEEVRVVIRENITKSRQNTNGNSPRSYTDALVLKQQEDMHKKENLFHDENLVASILDLVMAGTETTATTLQWAILLVTKYPMIQRKVQEEIRQVVKPGSWPTYEDRKSMHFTNAVIHEVQRFITLLPHVPRSTSVDIHFRGYFLPKGTMVIPSLTSVLLDPKHWETPHEFNPNHFLDADGKFVKKEAFVPYSLGRRNCMGETLAKAELFLFFTGLLQKFTFQPPPGLTETDLDLNVPETTFTLRPQPQRTCAIPRD